MSYPPRTFEVEVYGTHERPPTAAQLQFLLNFLNENTFVVNEVEGEYEESGGWVTPPNEYEWDEGQYVVNDE